MGKAGLDRFEDFFSKVDFQLSGQIFEHYKYNWHVICRSVGDMTIFEDLLDVTCFMDVVNYFNIFKYRRLGVISAIAFVGNHVHFLLSVNDREIGKRLVQEVEAFFASMFNARRVRKGKVFDGSLSEIVEIDKEEYGRWKYLVEEYLRKNFVESKRESAYYYVLHTEFGGARYDLEKLTASLLLYYKEELEELVKKNEFRLRGVIKSQLEWARKIISEEEAIKLLEEYRAKLEEYRKYLEPYKEWILRRARAKKVEREMERREYESKVRNNKRRYRMRS